MDLTFQVPVLCSLKHWSCFHHQTQPHLGVISTLPQPLHSFCSYFSAFFQWHVGYLPAWVGSSFHVISFCLFMLFMGFSGQEKWFAIPFFSRPHFFRTLHCDSSILGGPTQMAHSFIELHRAVIHIITLVSFL